MGTPVKFSGQLQGLRIDGNYTKKLDEALKVLIRKAAREWLKAVWVHVPVWSGQARGAIKFATGPNGNLAAALNVAIPINAPHPRPNKNEHTGTARYNLTYSRHIYRFSFRSDVIYYYLNEFYGSVSPSSPWFSMFYGERAFREAIRIGIPQLPKVKKHYVKVEIPID